MAMYVRRASAPSPASLVAVLSCACLLRRTAGEEQLWGAGLSAPAASGAFGPACVAIAAARLRQPSGRS